MDGIFARIHIHAVMIPAMGGSNMEDIIKHYGSGLLQIMGAILVMTMWMKLFQDDGIFRQICLQYMSGICG